MLSSYELFDDYHPLMITFLSFSMFVSNYSPLLLLFFTLWSASKPGMLRLCCVGSCFHVLCGVALFSVHNMPDLTSLFQEDVQASCFKPVLPVALVQSNTRPALGSVNVTLTCPVDPETGSLNARRPLHFQTCQHLCARVPTFYASLHQKHSCLPKYELLSRELYG